MDTRYLLVVDDDSAVRTVIADTLRRAGFEVECASDGAEALHVLFGRAGVEAILLDLVMPNVDGWGVLRAVRESTRLAHVPVVVLTSFAHDSLPVRVPVLYKPIEPDQLLALVETIREQERCVQFSLNEPPSDLLPRPHTFSDRPPARR